MFGFKKKKTQEMENETTKKEVMNLNEATTVTAPDAPTIEQQKTTEEPVKVTETEKQEKPMEQADQVTDEKEVTEEPELDPIGTPLTRPVRITVDTIVNEEKENVKRTAYDCDSSVVIMDTLVGAFRAGNQKDFQEKHTIQCVTSGFKDQAEPLRVLLDTTVKYLRMLSGSENEDALHANAVKAAGIILENCGVPAEHVHIEADEQFIEKIQKLGKKTKSE